MNASTIIYEIAEAPNSQWRNQVHFIKKKRTKLDTV